MNTFYKTESEILARLEGLGSFEFINYLTLPIKMPATSVYGSDVVPCLDSDNQLAQ